MPTRAAIAIKLGLLFLLLTPAIASARSLYGTVSKVQSAERLTVEHSSGAYSVRVYGVVTAADSVNAAAAKRLTEKMVGDKRVRVRIVSRNRNGEMESQILINGEDLALALLKAGLALRKANVHYKPTRNDQPDALVAAETEARLAHLGIWTQRAAATADGDAVAISPLADSLLAAGTVDTNASKKTGDDSECAIAIDPTNAQRMFQSCNTDSAGMFAAFSSNGGQSWSYPDPADKTIADGDVGQGQSACCDPTLTWDRFGNLYVTYISASLNTIVTLLSTNGGSTFSEIGSFSGSVDQPTITSASVGSNAAIWVVWNDNGAMLGRAALATALGTVSSFGVVQSTGSGDCTFGDVAVSATGVVVQACQTPSDGQGPANIDMNVDADGLGASVWSAQSTITATNVGGFDFIPAQNGRSVDAEAGLAYDVKSTSPRFGRLYLVYTDETTNESNDTNIMLRFSDNNGTTWSAPIRVDDDATTRSQFLPKIAVDPSSGVIGVCWHDARNSASNVAAEMFCATSQPLATPAFGASVRVSDGASTSNGAGVEFGDYMGLAFVGGEMHPVWGDTSNSTGDNPGGTANFDAYSDQVPLPGAADIFKNGFE